MIDRRLGKILGNDHRRARRRRGQQAAVIRRRHHRREHRPRGRHDRHRRRVNDRRRIGQWRLLAARRSGKRRRRGCGSGRPGSRRHRGRRNGIAELLRHRAARGQHTGNAGHDKGRQRRASRSVNDEQGTVSGRSGHGCKGYPQSGLRCQSERPRRARSRDECRDGAAFGRQKRSEAALCRVQPRPFTSRDCPRPTVAQQGRTNQNPNSSAASCRPGNCRCWPRASAAPSSCRPRSGCTPHR